MKLWVKISLITVVTILTCTGISGAVSIYHWALYNRAKTVESYERQVRAAAYAVGKELDYEPTAHFHETTVRSYYHYVIQKFGLSQYILIEADEVVCNKTPYTLENPADSRWGQEEGYCVVQKNNDKYILLIGQKVPANGNKDYKLVLVQDISFVYEDIRRQATFDLMVYLATALVAVLLVFAATHTALRPLLALQRAAQAISDGHLSSRAAVRRKDEIGAMAVAFNSMADRIERQVNELSEESGRRLQMLGSLTHEMKTPMTSIMGYADSLLHVKLSGEQKESALRHIYGECGRLGRLSSKLMSLIGMYDNDSIDMQEVSVQEMFKNVVSLEQSCLEQKGIGLEYRCEMDRRSLDRDLFESLLINLVDNAAKASHAGQTIWLTAQGNLITVRDEGCGIAREEIGKVTEAFYMVDKARSRQAGGCGLGLALCSRIASLHGATLQIESVEGKGTEVSVVFSH